MKDMETIVEKKLKLKLFIDELNNRTCFDDYHKIYSLELMIDETLKEIEELKNNK